MIYNFYLKFKYIHYKVRKYSYYINNQINFYFFITLNKLRRNLKNKLFITILNSNHI